MPSYLGGAGFLGLPLKISQQSRTRPHSDVLVHPLIPEQEICNHYGGDKVPVAAQGQGPAPQTDDLEVDDGYSCPKPLQTPTDEAEQVADSLECCLRTGQC